MSGVRMTVTGITGSLGAAKAGAAIATVVATGVMPAARIASLWWAAAWTTTSPAGVPAAASAAAAGAGG
jgi:hypothetical protein